MTSAVVTLVGISGVSGLAAVAIDADPNAVKPDTSKNFLRDIFPRFHRHAPHADVRLDTRPRADLHLVSGVELCLSGFRRHPTRAGWGGERNKAAGA
jgi:hypothetical protein